MPTWLVRYQHTGNFHFLTFSGYQGQPLLALRSGYSIFEQELEKARQRHGFVVAGYVVMPAPQPGPQGAGREAARLAMVQLLPILDRTLRQNRDQVSLDGVEPR